LLYELMLGPPLDTRSSTGETGAISVETASRRKQPMRGVHHTGITVSDLERSIAFYHGVLGLAFDNEPSPVFDDPELGPAVGVPGARLRQVTLKAGDDRVELLEYLAPESPIDSPMPQNALGSHHVAFRVDDIEAKVAELRSKGVEFFSAVNVVDEGVLAGWRWVYFADPDGITLELVEVAYRLDDERRQGIATYCAQGKPEPRERDEHARRVEGIGRRA
jgi:catechol 2,3-dioxygenase-like lactoylglutathione lyase family enzyme